MSKVLGVILTILGGMSSLFVFFLYLNTSAVFQYNPADKQLGLLDVGLALPAVFAGLILLAGVVILKTSHEPAVK
jgi:hypothetical protein